MNKFTTAAVLALTMTAPATAGGLDRSGLGISYLFESGDYAEISLGTVSPNVSGVATTPVAGESSGSMASSYFSPGMAVKTDLSDKLSIALSFENAYGAAIDYTGTDASYPVQGFTAELTGTAITALARYKFSDRFSVHGGARYVSMSGQVDFTALGGSALTYANSGGVGYVLGASYEIPDIALRASLTYNSATTHDNAITGSSLPFGPYAATTGSYTMPQSVNLDFQTGIAANTLLMASVRWADWSTTTINTQSALGTITHANDVITYNLGVGRKFSDSFSGVASVSYEAAQGGAATDLAPTDGKIGLTVAGVYTIKVGVSF
jgi:long-subunit fatty acid transport protein